MGEGPEARPATEDDFCGPECWPTVSGSHRDCPPADPTEMWADHAFLVHDPDGGLVLPYEGCPVCVAAGVLLCPGCRLPQRGWHTRCLPARRWLMFVAFVLALAAVLVSGLWLLVTYRPLQIAGAVLLVLALLARPHTAWIRAHLRR